MQMTFICITKTLWTDALVWCFQCPLKDSMTQIHCHTNMLYCNAPVFIGLNEWLCSPSHLQIAQYCMYNTHKKSISGSICDTPKCLGIDIRYWVGICFYVSFRRFSKRWLIAFIWKPYSSQCLLTIIRWTCPVTVLLGCCDPYGVTWSLF